MYNGVMKREGKESRTLVRMMDPTLEKPLHSSFDIGAQPLETFVETVATGGAGSLLKYGGVS